MRVLLSLCLALLLAGIGNASAQSWSEYRPAGAGFRIEMPGAPEVKQTNVVSLDRVQVMLSRAQATLAAARWPRASRVTSCRPFATAMSPAIN
jgi:hypothetical protein